MSTIIPRAGHTTFILSGHLTTKTAHESSLAHTGLAHDLSQLLAHASIDTFAHCRGAYKGEPEQSIAVTGVSSDSLEATILSLAEKYGQESILRIVGGMLDFGELLFTGHDYRIELIGQYRAIDSTNGVDAWTEVCATGETFTFV